jgi:hypothetical protein
MRLFILLLLVFLVGCSTVPKPQEVPELPLKELFNQIYKESYLIHVYDCSNKCAKYMRALDKEGYEVSMMVVKPFDSQVGMYHAIVRIKFDNKLSIYADVTNGKYSTNLSDYGYYLGMFELKDLHRNHDAFGDRLHEVKNVVLQ